MSSLPHISVLADEAIHYLRPRPGGRYIDGTLGAGGHSARILEAADDCEVLGIDRDRHAHDAARERLGPRWSRVHPVHGNFGDLRAIAEERGFLGADGVLVDLGVSSIQLDRPERGFSFSRPGPVDMRMDDSRGETALELIRRSTPDRLTAILRDYGEERYAPRIARVLKDAAAEAGELDTGQLAERIADCIPAKARRHQRIHPATKSFQALRIAVNEELAELERFLSDFPEVLAPGGRCVVISFHSLEDRMVKHRFRDLAWSSRLPPDLAREAGERVDPIVRVLTRKAITASDEEIAANPRARSAKLRACELFVEDPGALGARS